jgi:hypothetical protein
MLMLEGRPRVPQSLKKRTAFEVFASEIIICFGALNPHLGPPWAFLGQGCATGICSPPTFWARNGAKLGPCLEYAFYSLESVSPFFEPILGQIVKPFWGLFGARIWLRWGNMPARWVGIKRSKITNIFINEKTLKTIQFFMVLAT